jgi:hypothetical protein
MGNQRSNLQLQQQQQSYDHLQRELDRQVQMRGQDASVESAKIGASASMYGADTSARIADARLALESERFKRIELPKGLSEVITSTPEWKRQELLAKMGVDNVMATAIAGARGIDVMDPDSLKKMSPSEFRKLAIEIYGLQSTIFRETAGGAHIIDSGLREGAGDAKKLWEWFTGPAKEMLGGR